MKYKNLKIVLASLTTAIAYTGIALAIYFTYTLNGDHRALWIPLILGVFIFEVTCGLVLFSSKDYSDEIKAFWLFIILVFAVGGAIFWLFIGRVKQKTFAKGNSNQSTLLSHIMNAKKSILIYTNSFFISNDLYKAINLARWKNVDVKIVLSFDRKKWKNKILQYDINKFIAHRIEVSFTDKEIQHNFIIIDDAEVLFSANNFNYRNMYNDSKIFLAADIEGYKSLWNRDYVRTSKFEYYNKKKAWPIRLKNGIINIFYPFF